MPAAEGPVCPRCRSSLPASDPGALGVAVLSEPDCGRLDARTGAVPLDHPSEAGAAVSEWSDLGGVAGPGEVPRMLARYRLREPLGRGGFGQVFRAYDPRLDRDVALKVLRHREPAGRSMERFFREARAAAQLDHPKIVTLYDAGRDDRHCWIAYQLVAGASLADYRRTVALSVSEICHLVIGIAEALEHAHARGVVHRDVKPGNVLIDPRGEPRLTDFGLARREATEPDLTRLGAILGTRTYMSPEQAGGRTRVIDPRTDLYSLGVMLVELLCGERPAPGTDGLLAHRGRWPWRAPRTLNREPIPGRLVRICRSALAVDPEQRYRTATEMIHDLKGVAYRCPGIRRRCSR